ncbi:unnamed protein product, partial [Sphacelaria rigidula]
QLPALIFIPTAAGGTSTAATKHISLREGYTPPTTTGDKIPSVAKAKFQATYHDPDDHDNHGRDNNEGPSSDLLPKDDNAATVPTHTATGCEHRTDLPAAPPR